MKKSVLSLLLSCAVALNSCGDGGKTALSPKEFAQKTENTKSEIILDVRSPEEFASGHLPAAVNADWNGDQFRNQVQHIDKSTPLFVYCLSGGRSASAAAALREMGFSKVYEMQGGLMKWRAAQLPEEGGNVRGATGMSMNDYEAILGSKPLVLVDFYADWCGPCKKMKPFLEEIAAAQKEALTLLRIDVEANPEITKALGLDAVPVLKIYRNGKESWTNTGYIEKEDIEAQLK